MRRNIIKPTPQPAPKVSPKQRRVAALKAHLTRSEEALRRWQRRLRRALTEVQKHEKAVQRHQRNLEKEQNP